MRRLKHIIWQTFVILVIGVTLGFGVNRMSEKPLPLKRVPKSMDDRWEKLEAEEVKQLVENGEAILIDAREPKEYKLGHLPDAINLLATQFGEYFEEIGDALPREGVKLIVYCQGGVCDESHQVLKHLETLEFQNLYSYPGGWLDWKEKNYPIQKEEEGGQ